MLEEPQPGQLTPARDILQTARRPPRRQRRLNQRKKIHSELCICLNTRDTLAASFCRINKRGNNVNSFYDHRMYPARWWAVKLVRADAAFRMSKVPLWLEYADKVFRHSCTLSYADFGNLKTITLTVLKRVFKRVLKL